MLLVLIGELVCCFSKFQVEVFSVEKSSGILPISWWNGEG